MLAYADQNFLIRCCDTSDGRDVVIPTHKSGKATLVLSPMHFYEIGKVREDCYERTIQFVEEAQPNWILSRADLQLQEFLCEWNRFWNLDEIMFEPVGDLAHVASVMHKKPRERFIGLTPKDFIDYYRNMASRDVFQPVFEKNLAAQESNRANYMTGGFTPRVLREIERRFVATQLARLEEREPFSDSDLPILLQELHKRADDLLVSEPIFSRICIFVESGSVKRLKAHSVELSMFYNRLPGKAKLKEHSQVDREHAVVSLAYCDVFVTGDAELQKNCEQARNKSAFPLAKVIGCNEWIEYLNTGCPGPRL